MRNVLPILICTLLLAACGSHSDADSTAAAPATPLSTPAATAPLSAAASTAAPTAASSTAADTTAAMGTDDAASDTDSRAAAIDPSKVDFKDDGKWVEGKNYFLISPAQSKITRSNKIEVVEVFSWGCPACNASHPLADSMRKSLPDYAIMTYLPASFRPDENWVVYQRVFYTAQALGLAEKSYDTVFDAAWKSGELATYDLVTGQPKPRSQWPGIDAFAKFFASKYGVSESEFLAIAKSFSINTKMKRANELVKAYGIPSTPNFVVNGKYRFDFRSAGGGSQAIELAKWLAAKEAAGK